MSAIIIRGGRVLDVTRHRAEPSDVLVDDGAIREIGRPGLAAPEGAAVLDARDRLLIPGLVNAHTHSHGALTRGLPGDRVPLEILLTTGAAIGGSRGLEDKYLVEEAKVRAAAEAVAARLREANKDAVAAARALEDYAGAFCVGLAREPYRVARVLSLDA